MSPFQTRKYGHAFEAYRTRHAYVRQYGYRSDENIQRLGKNSLNESILNEKLVKRNGQEDSHASVLAGSDFIPSSADTSVPAMSTGS